ncbi:MAG: hypothetical protein ACLTYN_08005 [Dysosmobacter welbionis]
MTRRRLRAEGELGISIRLTLIAVERSCGPGHRLLRRFEARRMPPHPAADNKAAEHPAA